MSEFNWPLYVDVRSLGLAFPLRSIVQPITSIARPAPAHFRDWISTMPRAIASLSLSFGLVSIPVKLFSATEASTAVRFKLMRADGARVRQQYVSDAPTDERPEQEAATPSNSRRFTASGSPPLAQSSNVRELRAR